MSSWGSEGDTTRPAGRGSADPDDPGDPDVTAETADVSPPVPPPVVDGVGSPDDPPPFVDPLPSSGSLRWAPDPTEPTVRESVEAPAGEAGRGDPPDAAPAAGWAPPRHRAARGRALRPRRSEGLVLGGIAVVVLAVGVAASALTGGDGWLDPLAEETQPTVTPLAAGAIGPIVGPTGVIGWWSGSEWQARPAGAQPGAGLDYTVVGVGDTFGTAPGEAVTEDCPAQMTTSDSDVAVAMDAGGGGEPPPIAVAGVAEPRPRPVQQFDTGSDVYRQAAADAAAGLGATTPPTLTQVLRADLDGSGTQEVVVAAEHLSDPDDLSPSAGDWSIVFLRRVAGNAVATDVLASSVVGGDSEALERIQVATLADLNGDGTMEVALHGRSSSGEWTSIHALGSDGVLTEVLRAGCVG
jgi:hypothetical protein